MSAIMFDQKCDCLACDFVLLIPSWCRILRISSRSAKGTMICWTSRSQSWYVTTELWRQRPSLRWCSGHPAEIWCRSFCSVSSFVASVTSFWRLLSLIGTEDITKRTQSFISLLEISGVLSYNAARFSVSVTFINYPFVYSRSKSYFWSLKIKHSILGGAVAICVFIMDLSGLWSLCTMKRCLYMYSRKYWQANRIDSISNSRGQLFVSADVRELLW